ncbi:hypothetical protein LDENG_00229490 [Lucifuga dentata]|nr:hypothetical protein LDENG_00229490 [Lucifuga dentata]
MDPFTEKLLERTRARRENLQKKMAERPNAANRQMVKRSREPLTDTNDMLSEPLTDKVPHAASKPSPSKRRCSAENTQPSGGEENQEPPVTQPVVPMLPDPPADTKPQTDLANVRPALSLEKTAGRPVAQTESEQMRRPETSEAEMKPAGSVLQSNRAEEAAAPFAPGMKSRLQRLAEQRKCWDGQITGTSSEFIDDAPPSPLKRQADIPPAVIPSASSEAPLGRKGRLANLAATIRTWEDDLSHTTAPKDNAQGKPTTASIPKAACRDTASVKAADQAATSTSRKPTSSTDQQAMICPAKPSRLFLPSPHTESDTPVAKPAPHYVTSSHKSSCQEAIHPSSPSSPASQSPLKNQAFSRGLKPTSSPQKPDLHTKPANVGPSALQQKASAGTPGVKSFLERFGERCHERMSQSSPAGGSTHTKTTVTPSVTPNTRLVQEKLRAAQAASTSTTDLIQRQKLERESELAQLRSRCQKENNMWKSKDKWVETKENTEVKEQVNKPVDCEAATCQPHDKLTAPSTESSDTSCSASTGHDLPLSPLASASSLLKAAHRAEKTTEETSEEEVITEVEMNVDQSINSAMINELFDGVLKQSGDQRSEEEEEEEEDALNISSMSLLAPLAETVATVVKSPERRMMTSTPASSFSAKSNTPDNVSGKFQRTNKRRTASSDRSEASDEDLKLPYSIDAYRSTRVKDTERPIVKHVVRKEDVSRRVEDPRSASIFSVKQKMKV